MKLLSRSLQDTLKIGKRIAVNLGPGDIICLVGQLGSGKTTLTKGIAEGLGICRDAVISPSFVLIRQHTQGEVPLYHFDLYRLKTREDILALGYEEYLYDEGISVIEWSEKLGCLLPRQYMKITLTIVSDSQRLFELSAFGRHYKEVLKRIGKRMR